MDSSLYLIKRKVSTPSQDTPADSNFLEDLDEIIYSSLTKGEINQALTYISQSLSVRTSMFGTDSNELFSYLSELVQKSCGISLALIDQNKSQSCIDLLRNLLQISSNYPISQLSEETIEVYSTISIALRKLGKISIAKKYALKALDLSSAFVPRDKLLSSIYMNLCSISSSMSQHKEAANYCQKAIPLLQEAILNSRLSDQEESQQEVAVLAVAYHNLGVEEEYLKNYESALTWYKKAYEFINKYASIDQLSMIEQFKRSYEEAKKTCKKKFNRVEMNRSMKDFFNGSVFSEIDMRLSELNRSRRDSGMSSSGQLLDFGMYEKEITRRTRSSGRIKNLTPLKKSQESVSSSQNKIRIRKDSSRSRKIIKEKLEQNLAFKAALKIQTWIRKKKAEIWYREIKGRKLFGLKLRCEKEIYGGKYLTSFSVDKGENSLCVIVRAIPLQSFDVPGDGKYSLYEVCELISAWDVKTFELKKSEILLDIDIEDNKVVLKKLKKEVRLVYQRTKRLNNCHVYQISIFFIENNENGSLVVIDGRALKESPEILGSILIDQLELASMIEVRPADIEKNLENIWNLLVIEGEGFLSLSKKEFKKGPRISFNLTNTNDFSDEYRHFENTQKKLQIKEKFFKFCVGKKDIGKSAVIIQKNFKMFRTRKAYLKLKRSWISFKKKCSFRKFLQNIIIIQKHVRGFLARRLKALLIDQQNFAAVIIQSIFKGWVTRKLVPEYKKYKIEQDKKNPPKKKTEVFPKPKLMQVLSPDVLMKYGVVDWLKRMKYKRPCAQRALAKGVLDSFEFKHYNKENKLKCVLNIQKFLRGKFVLKNIEKKRKAAVFIQKMTRGFLARKLFKVRMKAVKNIERCIKAWVKKLNKACVIIQKFYKGSKQRKTYNEYMKLRKAAIKVQKSFRGYLLRKKIFKVKEIRKEQRNSAAVKIQRRYRTYITRKRFKRLRNFQQYTKKGSTLRTVIKSTVVIQGYIRRWIIRKTYNPRASPLKVITSVIIIQRWTRGWQARRLMEDLNNGNLVVSRFGMLLDNNPHLVSISKTKREYVVRAVHCSSLVVVYRTFDQNEHEYEKVSDNIYMRNGCIFLSVTKTRKPIKYLLHDVYKELLGENYNLKIYLETDNYLITLTLDEKTTVIKLKFSDLVEKYSDRISLEELTKDIRLSGTRIYLEANMFTVRQSKLVLGKLYTVTMYEKGKFLIFEVMLGGDWKKRVFVVTEQAARYTGITGAIKMLGYYLIKECLMIIGGKITFLYRMRRYDILGAIIKIQTFIRAFLQRARMKRRNLISIVDKSLSGTIYRLSCHFFANKYEIMAKSYSDFQKIQIKKPNNCGNAVEYLTNEIIPNLYLTDSLPHKLIYKPKLVPPDLTVSKSPKNSLKMTNFSTLLHSTPNLVLYNKKSPNGLAARPSPVVKKKKSGSIQSSRNQSESVALSISRPVDTNQSLESYKEKEKILLKTGVVKSGIFLIVTIKARGNKLYVEACNENGLIDLYLYLKNIIYENFNEKETDDLCNEIMDQINIVTDLNSNLKLALVEKMNENIDKIIHQKTHLISHIHLDITVFQNSQGLFLTAKDHEKRVFYLKLGKKHIEKNLQNLNDIIKKLKISVILGEEVIVSN